MADLWITFLLQTDDIAVVIAHKPLGSQCPPLLLHVILVSPLYLATDISLFNSI